MPMSCGLTNEETTSHGCFAAVVIELLEQFHGLLGISPHRGHDLSVSAEDPVSLSGLIPWGSGPIQPAKP